MRTVCVSLSVPLGGHGVVDGPSRLSTASWTMRAGAGALREARYGTEPSLVRAAAPRRDTTASLKCRAAAGPNGAFKRPVQ